MQRNTLAKIRYGFGLKPGEAAVAGADDLLAEVSRPNRIGYDLDVTGRLSLLKQLTQASRAERDGKGSMTDVKTIRDSLSRHVVGDMARTLSRAVAAPSGFQERLFFFWADHFTVSAKNQRLAVMLPAYWDDAIRPNLGGRFADMLFAVVTHPAMLSYLDQAGSVGPNSRVGQRRGRGLNENLARELLELHTMGVGSGYAQEDVTQLAELLTGLNFNVDGFRFTRAMAEPGAETILGKKYGGGKATLDHIRAALDDVAMRPETAAHLARMLVQHFVGVDDVDMIAAVADAYRGSGGDLTAAYGAMLAQPLAWDGRLQKIKPPMDYMVSALRALEFTGLTDLSRKDFRQWIMQPMTGMGQTPFRPQGPDGWSEDAADWITPATLAARIEWAASVAREVAPDRDPRRFVELALADAASDQTRFAARAAESKWEGIAVVLAAPEFNRR